ncbi:MAG: hypothetical protein WC859_06160 [Elusimicrobiota bacterium]|jgi:hypothetical protein
MKTTHACSVSVLLVIGLLASQWFFWKAALEAQERLGLRRLQKAFTQLVERACLTQDDLLVQQILKALSGAQGLAYAALLDDHQGVLAHTDPSQLGARLNLSTRKRNQIRMVSTVSLSNTSSIQGQLLIVYSNPQRRQWLKRGALLLSGMVVFLGGLTYWQFWRFNRDLQGREKRIRDLEETLADLQGQAQHAQHQARQMELTWQHYLSSALKRIPVSLLLLDNHQRLVARSPAASSSIAPGCSWHEMPFLSNAGASLEKSLQSPGQVFEVSSPEHGRIQLETFHVNEETCTWVTLL